MSLIFRLFFDCCRSVRSCSARVTAASMLIGSGVDGGRSTGLIDEVHSGSSVPLTISRFSASSDVRTVACAWTSVCRRLACFGLRGDDVDRRQRADFDAGLVVLHETRRRDRASSAPLRPPGWRTPDPSRRCARSPACSTVVACSAISSFCWLIRLVCSAARVESILKPRSSG